MNAVSSSSPPTVLMPRPMHLYGGLTVRLCGFLGCLGPWRVVEEWLKRLKALADRKCQLVCFLFTEKDLFLNTTISEVFYFYVAVTEQNQKVYFYIGQSRSWSSAQNYCREHYLDLAMIENQEENTRAGSAAPSSPLTWIGLYREPWTWSDQSHSTFRNNIPAGLTNPSGGHCVLENTDDHLWDNQDCSVKNGFICQQGDDSVQVPHRTRTLLCDCLFCLAQFPG
uniref:C-type lectin domain-containing protein n=1 Tax=Oryzias latipes TaxID=8090 RepID=A0A3B3HNV6_ORYLA